MKGTSRVTRGEARRRPGRPKRKRIIVLARVFPARIFQEFLNYRKRLPTLKSVNANLRGKKSVEKPESLTPKL
jgi:hypothetical protein